jgi:hypothetical protein
MLSRSPQLGLKDSGHPGLKEPCDRASFSYMILGLEAEIGSCPSGFRFGDPIHLSIMRDLGRRVHALASIAALQRNREFLQQ